MAWYLMGSLVLMCLCIDLLLASRSHIQPYFYFSELDILLRCQGSFEYGPPQLGHIKGLVGAMMLYMLLRPKTTISKSLAKVLAKDAAYYESGWQASLEKS